MWRQGWVRTGAAAPVTSSNTRPSCPQTDAQECRRFLRSAFQLPSIGSPVYATANACRDDADRSVSHGPFVRVCIKSGADDPDQKTARSVQYDAGILAENRY